MTAGLVPAAQSGGPRRARDVLILGLGNDILRDDGVGLVASRRVAELAGDRADHAEACVATLDLLPMMAGYDRVIVVDAYLAPTAAPGSAVRVTSDALPRGFGYRSPHTLPFREMLELGRSCGMAMPREIALHGLRVEEVTSFGSSFSPAVERRWRAWADEIARREFGL